MPNLPEVPPPQLVNNEMTFDRDSWIPHLEALNVIIAEVAGSNDLPSLLQLTLEQLKTALQMEMGAIWVMGYHISSEIPSEIINTIRGMTQTAAPITIADLQHDTSRLAKKLSAILVQAGIRSTMIVPILTEGRVIGRLVMLSQQAREWSQEETLFARLVGKQLGVAADRVRLTMIHQPQATQRDIYLERLILLSEDLNRTSSVDEVLDAIGNGTRLLSEVKQTAIFLINPDNRIYCPWSHALSENVTQESVKYLSDLLSRGIPEGPNPHLVTLMQDESLLPELRDSLHSTGIHALGFWPLQINDQSIAILGCYYDSPHQWTDPELEAMLAFSRQAVNALENARLLQKHERRAQQLATLNELSRKLASTLDLEPLLKHILSSAVEILDCEAGSLLLADENTGELVFQESVGPVAKDLIGQRIPPRVGLAGKAVETREPIIVNDVRQSEEWFHQTDKQTGFVTEAMMVAPLIARERVIGVIEVINKQSGAPFSREEQELIIAFASQAAVALDNARLFSAERRRSEEFEALRQASLQLTSSLDLAQVLDAILENALKLIAGDEAHIFLADGDRLIPGASRWLSGKPGQNPPVPHPSGLLSTVFRSGRKIVIRDASTDAFYPDLPDKGAMLGLPLQKGDLVRGVMSIHFNEPHYTDKAELRVLELLADQAAVALENASLFVALQEKLHELSSLSEASAALRDAENLKEMGPLLANHVARMVGADASLVYLMDSDLQHLVPVGSAGISKPLNPLEWTLGNNLINQAIRTGSLHYLSGSETTSGMVQDGLPDDLRPAMCIPIRTTRGQVVGAFLVARRKGIGRTEVEFRIEEQRALKTLAEIAGNALLRARSHEDLETAYIQTVLALANAVDARDTYTNDHSQRLAILAEATAIELNCTPEEIQAIHWGALLHDIGKIGVPDDILSKPGPLNEHEWDIMKKHPEIGANIVAPLKRMSSVAPIIQAHQEKFDGTGYPKGLKADEIPLPARILAVVDAYSAIIDDRVYRSARSHEEAVQELKRCSGTHFDPRVVEAFLQVLEKPWES